MTLETFNFPLHTVALDYPETGAGVQFGNSYSFRSAPTAPAQRTFNISLQGMRYIHDELGDFSRTLEPTYNILKFQDFYDDHQMHKTFEYPHETEGTLVVRFKSPLKIPTAIKGGMGIFPAFDIQIIEQP